MAGDSNWQRLLVVHRLTFPLPISYVCTALWGASFAVASPTQLLTSPVLIAAGANGLVLLGGLALNTVADVPSDTGHADKRGLATAARRLGFGRAVGLVAGELVAGVALAVLVTALTARWICAVAAAGTVVLHCLYNIEPFRLKHRGLLGAVAFGSAASVLPCLLAYGAVRSDIDASRLLIFVGLGVLTTGRTAWWSVPDRAADAAVGAATPTVRLGASRAALVSCLLMGLGLGVMYAGLYRLHGPIWAGAGILAHLLVLGFAAAPLVLSAGRRGFPSSRWMRTRVLPMVALGDLALLLLPLLAPELT